MLVTFNDAARLVGRTRQTIETWQREGMPTVKDGHRVLVDVDVVWEWRRRKFIQHHDGRVSTRWLRNKGLGFLVNDDESPPSLYS